MLGWFGSAEVLLDMGGGVSMPRGTRFTTLTPGWLLDHAQSEPGMDGRGPDVATGFMPCPSRTTRARLG